MIRGTNSKILKTKPVENTEYVRKSNALIEEITAIIDNLDIESSTLIENINTELAIAKNITKETRTEASQLISKIKREHSEVRETFTTYLRSLEEEIGDLTADFKAQEIDTFSKVEELIKDVNARQGEPGEQGEPGKDGEDYVLTEKDKAEIASSIEVPVVEKIIEKIEVQKTDESLVKQFKDEIAQIQKDFDKKLEEYKQKIEVTARNFVRGGGMGEAEVQALIDASSSTTSWGYYKDHWSAIPTNLGAITGGNVWSYTLSETTRYRFVPTTYDPTKDAFYTTYSEGILSGLIVTRG